MEPSECNKLSGLGKTEAQWNSMEPNEDFNSKSLSAISCSPLETGSSALEVKL